MNKVYTNTSANRDFTNNWFSQIPADTSTLYAATAFVTHSQLLLDQANRGKFVKLVCRLGYPTNPKALAELIAHDNIDVRYISSEQFHPKLYIAGTEGALVGSANMTESAMRYNQEVSVVIEPDDDIFIELQGIFADYWDSAEVLSAEVLRVYKSNWVALKEQRAALTALERNLTDGIEEASVQNLTSKTRRDPAAMYRRDFQQQYQEAETAFNQVKRLYLAHGVRKVEDDQQLPINLEVDLFLSFVREEYATNEDSLDGSNKSDDAILGCIKAWHKDESSHLFNTVLPLSYPEIQQCFSSSKTLKSKDAQDVCQALLKLNAFRAAAKRRGYQRYCDNFIADNGAEKIIASLEFLLFGRGDQIERMATLIFDRRMQLRGLGRASIQELVGWVHAVNSPIVNGRTTRALRYFGFDVKQL